MNKFTTVGVDLTKEVIVVRATDAQGRAIYFKPAGRFLSDWRSVRSREMDWTGLKLLLEGIKPARQRKRYRLPTRVQLTVAAV